MDFQDLLQILRDFQKFFQKISPGNCKRRHISEAILYSNEGCFYKLLGRGTCPDSGYSSICPYRLVNTVLKLFQNDLSRFSPSVISNKIIKQYFQILVPNTLSFLLVLFVLGKYLQVFQIKSFTWSNLLYYEEGLIF